ncbi:sodium-dependent bicarbonate transport family permease [Paenibacillus sp. YYML68]|uniref:sodium-dependent bicarbonate transport family permease n=1 Tax=Paenibacillus sp. YYML68 TaxID=2909250 RepID=UPI0024905691|nr:sodium-dependent bicarbonate transport family permease [Paenibacillus sp. YYML68]
MEFIVQHLTSPAVLLFVLGLLAASWKSDLKFPPALMESLSIYLLLAIGLKGGMELAHFSLHELVKPAAVTIGIGVLIPFGVFAAARAFGFKQADAIAAAATYGSVSIVTFGIAASYLQELGMAYEGYMSAMVVLLESPAILTSLLLYAILKSAPASQGARRTTQAVGVLPGGLSGLLAVKWGHVLREGLLGQSVLLLIGGLVIGMAAGENALPVAKPLFIDLYPSILMLFLLGMGLKAGERLGELKAQGLRVVGLALLLPPVLGAIGVLLGHWSGMSVGGAALLGVMAASGSYIAAPAALRTAVPEANPSVYIGMALAVTFPFNLLIGLPLMVQLAQALG